MDFTQVPVPAVPPEVGKRNTILIAYPCAFWRQAPTVTQWIGQTTMQMHADHARIQAVYQQACNKARIHNSRNGFVEMAKEMGVDFLLFIDPDMYPDYHLHSVKDGSVKPFWQTSWDLMISCPSIAAVAAPACGGPPEFRTNVFIGGKQLSRQEATELKPGFYEVDAIGTGLMLIRMSVFEKLKPPYFTDTYNDPRELDVNVGQDCYFCERCVEAGYSVVGNMFAWSGHWKDLLVGKPGLDGLPIEGLGGPKDIAYIEDVNQDGAPDSTLEQLVGA